jgi:hypothetical protein
MALSIGFGMNKSTKDVSGLQVMIAVNRSSIAKAVLLFVF